MLQFFSPLYFVRSSEGRNDLSYKSMLSSNGLGRSSFVLQGRLKDEGSDHDAITIRERVTSSWLFPDKQPKQNKKYPQLLKKELWFMKPKLVELGYLQHASTSVLQKEGFFS